MARLPTWTLLFLKLAGIRVIWKDYCPPLSWPPAEIWEVAFLKRSQLILKLGSWEPFGISLHYHTLNMRFMCTHLASSFHNQRGEEGLLNVWDILKHTWSIYLVLDHIPLTYWQNVLAGKLAALVWDDVFTFLAQIENTLALRIFSRCSTDKRYLIGKVWRFGQVFGNSV